MLDTIADIDLAVNLEVDEQIIVDRIVNRRSCKACNEVYHLVAKPTSEVGVCDKCGGDLYQRTDDTEAVVRERLRVYKERTQPLARFYADRGRLVDVNGQGEIDDVFDRTLAAIKKFYR
jgi:adenylate kinase